MPDAPQPSRRLPDASIALILFAANLVAIGPHLLTDFSSQPWNNDYIYTGEARVFRDFPWTWNPLQYAGVPFAYVYPPVFPLLMLAMPVASLGRAYHLASGFGYALVPVALYVLALRLFRSRLAAGFAAAAYGFVPLPGLVAAHGVPWGLTALTAYAEAPHTLALALILFTAAAAWSGRRVLACALAALVFLTSVPGIVGLAIALAAVAAGRSHGLGIRKAAALVFGVAGAGYGLAAFWITPGFFAAMRLLDRVILRHELAPAPWTAATWMIAALGAVVALIAFLRRVPASAAFVAVFLAVPGAAIGAFAANGSHLLPVPHRYMLELTAGLALAIGWLLSVAGRWRVYAAAAAGALGLLAAAPFVPRIWQLQDRGIDPKTTAAFQVADWLERHAGGARVFTAGELDGSLNIWSRVPQVGGSHNGISNFLVVAAQKEVSLGCGEPARTTRIAELWLRALDARYVAVHEGASREYFHWFSQPQKFAGFPVAWSNGTGDAIYRVPGAEGSSAVVVDLSRLHALPPLHGTGDLEFLTAYTDWARGIRPAVLRWTRADAAEIDADLGADEAVLVKVNYDPGWSVPAGAAERDPIGFLLLRAPAGHAHFGLRFGASWDTWLGRAITLLTASLLILRIPLHWIAAASLVPAGAAFAFLAAHAPPGTQAAEATFRDLRPPAINPAGIVDSATFVQPPLTRGRVIAIYGRNLGGPADPVRVWVAGREARITHREPVRVDVELPADAPASAEVQLEVNGCRSNSFAIETRDAAHPGYIGPSP